MALPSITTDQLDQAAALLEQGATVENAAAQAGCSKATLYYRARSHQRLRAILDRREHKPSGGAKLTSERAAELRHMWTRMDLTLAEIASAFQICESTLSRWKTLLELPDRPARGRSQIANKQEKQTELRRLWADHLSLADMASLLGVSETTVHTWGRDLGLPSRPRGRRTRPRA